MGLNKFFKKVGVFSGILCLIFVGINTYSDANITPPDYLGCIKDKHERALSIKEPKLIFAGGSNLAFGIDSELIQAETGIPVVNLGHHGKLGLSFIINEVKAVSKKNDLVFLSIEHFMDLQGDFKLQMLASEFYPEASNFYNRYRFPLWYWENTKKNIQEVFDEKTEKQEKKHIYTRSAFNEYGDVVAHLTEPTRTKDFSNLELTYRYWEGIDAINELHSFAKAHGFTVYYLFPSYCESNYLSNQEAIKKLESDLQSDLEIEILNKSNSFVYPDSLFFDTRYHLHAKGRELRTKSLIELILPIVEP